MVERLGTFVVRAFRWLGRFLAVLLVGVGVAWAALALYFMSLPWAWVGGLLAAAFVVFSLWTLGRRRTPRARAAFALVLLGVVAWFASIRPSHDRPWRPEVAVMPRAEIDGDVVRISGYRDFEYRSRDDFTERYEVRDVELSHLVAVDFFVSFFWPDTPVGHTFVSFIFDNAPPVSISIETRPEVGESFAPIASLFKQFELIYLVGSERDIVGVRTNHRREGVYLFRIQTSPEFVRRLFLIYLERINELADQPEWYHLLTNSCTINIVRYANAAGREGRFDIRHLLNGLADAYLYSAGFLDTTLPLEELRRRSRVNEAAEAAEGSPDFSRAIRESLPAMSP
jgi:hypothetical protein